MDNDSTSNEKLCIIFEMLVSRLDTLERKLDAQQAQLDLQHLASRYADSLRRVGETFSGVALTGICVELRLFERIDSDGNFLCARDDFLVIDWFGSRPSTRDAALSQADLCQMVDGVLAVGDREAVISLCDVKTAVTAVGEIFRLCQLSPPSTLEIYRVNQAFKALAIARATQTHRRQAWSDLTKSNKMVLIADQDSENVYFTNYRLACFQ